MEWIDLSNTQPATNEYSKFLERPSIDKTILEKEVTQIIQKVKKEGDIALQYFSQKIDGVVLENFEVTEAEWNEAITLVPETLKQAIQHASENIRRFHSIQIPALEEKETIPGVLCWRKSVPIQKVGLYIPGGSAPLFSTVLMLGIPATIAGCKEVIMCTPPLKNGAIAPAVLYAAKLAGVHKIWKIGGAQAIAAMAYGTQSVLKVHKIFGPGNQYVTCAKQLVQLDGVAIDMPAGPSELCILADDTAQPKFIAADLLSQAEHGADSQVILVTTSKTIAVEVQKQIEQQINHLPRKTIVQNALKHSKCMYVSNIEAAVSIVNEYAPEHLIISCNNANEVTNKIVNAGSVFIGNYTPESAGDYASGTNHTLPTHGFAKAYSGVSVDSFLKKITFQKISEEGLHSLSETIIQMAQAEGLQAHAEAVKIRLHPS